MDDFTDRQADHGGTATEERPTAQQQLAAEQACDALLRRIETAAARALGGARHGHTDDDAPLAALVREYARCARTAGMRPEQMVKPLKVAMAPIASSASPSAASSTTRPESRRRPDALSAPSAHLPDRSDILSPRRGGPPPLPRLPIFKSFQVNDLPSAFVTCVTGTRIA